MTRIKLDEINTGWGDPRLFPPQGKEKAELALKKIEGILDREYKMRQYVFRHDRKKLQAKTKEIDEGYVAVRDLREVIAAMKDS